MTTDEIDDSSAPLIEHLAELRNRLMWAALAFFVAMLAVYPVAQNVFNFLTTPLCNALEMTDQSCGLVYIKMQEGFFVNINIAMFGGFIVSFPVIAYQLWRFIAPGLYKSERNAFLPFLIASPAMFFFGAAFCFYIVLPTVFSFFLGFQQGDLASTPDAAAAVETGAKAMPGLVFQGSAQEYMSLTMKFILAFGLCFQLPVLLTLMGKAGLVSSKGLGGVRKYAIVAILVVAAIITPPDVMSQVILFAAIYPLYEVSIHIIARMERTREARMRAEGTWVEDDEEEDEKA